MKLSYGELIQREIAKSRKQRNAARLLYYTQALDGSAAVSWETFQGSWAHSQWMDKHYNQLNEFVREQNRRFGYMGSWSYPT